MRKPLLVAGAITLAVGTLVATGQANAAPPSPTTTVTLPHLPKVGEVGPDGKRVQHVSSGAHLVGTRKATAEDVASGFATSLAATVNQCNDSTPLDSPYTGASDAKLGLSVGWEESTVTGSGRPEARIRSGNALFVFNNHTDTGRAVYWRAADWRNWNGGIDEILFIEAAGTVSNTFYIPNGKSLGIKVNADGTVAAPWSYYKNPNYAWGFRQFVEFYPNGTPGSIPKLLISTATANDSHSQYSDVRIYATGVCANDHLILY